MTSLRTRLVGATCLVAVVALSVAGFATYRVYASSQLREVDDQLQRTHESVEHLIEAGEPGLESSIEQLVPGLFAAVIAPDGTVAVSIPARIAGHDPLTTDVSDLRVVEGPPGEYADAPAFSTRLADGTDTELRLRTSRLDDGTVLVLGISLAQVDASRQRLLAIEAIVAAVALVVAAVVGWFLVNAGLRPLHTVEASARRIADDGDLDHEVGGGDGPAEIGRLVHALNTMLDRIRQAFAERDAKEVALQTSEQRMRQLVADVSHELRTPLAAVSAYAELIDRGARDRPDDLARALHGIGVESGRMRELVEELLLLARLDEGRPLQLAPVDLSAVVVEAVGAARAVSSDWPISLRITDLVVVEGDASRLRQVIDNLLANVRTHTPIGTRTSIEVRSADEHGVITVADDGPGMTTEQATHVFERFFRADRSRSRSSGGSGLGLAIVRALVDAHHGRIAVDTAPDQGVRITIELPLRRSGDGT